MSKGLIEQVNSVIRELDDAERYPLSDRRPGYFERCRDALEQCRDELAKQAEYIAGLRQTIRSIELKLWQQAERVKALERLVVEWNERVEGFHSRGSLDFAVAVEICTDELAAVLKEGE